MLDVFGLPPAYGEEVRIYENTGGVNYQGWQTWDKPKGASMVMMIAISGGGGGGGGFSRTAGSAGGGGGSGACSGIARFICPAIFLPQTMYVQVGAGGQGGAAGANGGAGTHSFIVMNRPISGGAGAIPVIPNIICYSGVNAPGGGGGGTGAAAGAAGTVPTVAVTQPCNVWGQWFAIVGTVGVAGGAQTGAAGADITSAWGTIPMSPGAGGAGCTTTDFKGGGIQTAAIVDFGGAYFATGADGVVKGGTAAGAGVDGGSGISIWRPFFQTGGAGGGSNNSGQAGNGGNGGIGCGGGGGGAGTTGGRGGNGGNGLVVIISW